MARKIRTGDKVIVITGSDKGKISEVKSVKGDRAIVEGVNLRTRCIKKRREEPGYRESFNASIHLSNLAHVVDGKPIKVRFKDGFLEAKKDGSRIRKV